MPIRYVAPDPLAELRARCLNWNDEFLAEQYHLGRRSYASEGAWQIVRTEYHERGLASDDPSEVEALDRVDPTFDTPEDQIAFAMERLQEGASWANVQAEILEAGPMAVEARHLLKEFAVARRDRAERSAFQGVLWFGGGLAVTVLTYMSATPGETYIVAWGAIIFGAMQAMQGFAIAHEPLPDEDDMSEPVALEDSMGSGAARQGHG